ncbi:tumor necrosis factor receptor superfamily member 5-like [Anoplopoma fimbria]|uniref:tumor necrosis factor receptor superfamily member 5-like n=1 Tax=Anoplopoma fimbria TaxID=229290 RepID=UPI0023ED4276|nr:tumor necrosis factor receptor superfamily member 5-like [Anoplopoma fimbria]
MIPLSRYLALMCVLSIWTIAAGCGDGQDEVNGRCCDLCHPGTYMKGFCSEKPSVCIPCEEGHFSDKYNMFDRCHECRSCQQDYAKKCTTTTDAICSCRSGFLCSNNACSKCEENKCVTGEKPNRTDSRGVNRLIKYSYTCEPQPSCPDNSYFDVKADVCKTHREGIDSIHLILGIGFVLLSLTLLMFLSLACIKNFRKHKAYNTPMEVLAVPTKASDFHLSKEECGFELIVQDESKNSNSFGPLHLEEVGTC